MVKKSHPLFGPILIVVFFLTVQILAAALLGRERGAVLEQKQQLARLNQDLARLDEILFYFKNNQEEIQKVAQTLPASYQEVAYFVAQVEGLASQHEQTLTTEIEKIASTDPVGRSSLAISLEMTGRYDSLAGLLSDLSHLPYHTKVDSLKIEETKSGLFAVIKFRLYLSNQEER